jgi:hypothetical protein
MRRRTWLALGAGSAVVLAVAGGSLALLGPALRDGRLSDGAREVFGAAARGVLEGTLPEGTSQPAAMKGLIGRIEALISNLPPHAQAELGQLLALLASAPRRVGMASLHTRWEEASPVQVQVALQSMRTSSISLRRQAYQALHDIVGAAYFSDPGTWVTLGYPGPVPV